MIISIPTSPDAITLQLVIRARLFLEHAISHASSSSSVDSMIAIHGLDNVVEFLLRIMAKHLAYEDVTGSPFPASELAQMAGELNKFLKEKYNERLPYLEDIKTLRQVRNLVQHGAVDPARDLERFTTVVSRFFERISNLCFGLSVAQLFVSQIIKDNDTKENLKLAEAAISEDRCLDAVVATRDAFDNALFRKRSNSRSSIYSAPAIAELSEQNSSLRQLFDVIVEEIDLAKLNVNFSRYERFRRICDHIPKEYRAEWRSNIVMQRPWAKGDAEFCYGFVTDCVLRWQAEEFDPLYPIAPNDKYEFKESIDGIEIVTLESGIYYDLANGEVKTALVPREVKEQLEKLIFGKTYVWQTLSWKNDKLDVEIERLVKLEYFRAKLVTHSPARWEIIMSLQNQPFSWHRKDYKDGEMIEESISINDASAEELTSLYGIDKEFADKVVSYRNAIGRIEKVDDLRKIVGITETQIEWLTGFTRL